jgi:malonyl-CoA O-methyltransferase
MNRAEAGWRAYYEEKADSFDELAATYGSQVPLARMFYGARHDAVVGAMPSGGGRLALDLGCGSGAYLPALAERCRDVVAVDLAHGYVRQATARQQGSMGVQGSAVALPFRDGTFDLVLATEVIEHLPQPTALLDEVERVLKPDGAFVLTTPNPLTPHDLLYRVKRRVRGFDVDEHPGLMLPWVLTREIGRRKFVEERRVSCNFLYPYPVGELLGRLPNQSGIAAASQRLERGAQRAPIVRRFGWTQIRTLRRTDA